MFGLLELPAAAVMGAAAGAWAWPIATVFPRLRDDTGPGEDEPVPSTKRQRLGGNAVRFGACAATGALSMAVTPRLGSFWPVPAFCIFLAAIVAASLVDIVEFRIPRRLIWQSALAGGALLVVASGLSHHWFGLVDAAIAAGVLFTLAAGFHALSPNGFGFGDVRMIALTGMFVGWIGIREAFFGLIIATLAAGTLAAALLLAGIAKRTSRIPFGPFIAVGAIVAILAR